MIRIRFFLNINHAVIKLAGNVWLMDSTFSYIFRELKTNR